MRFRSGQGANRSDTRWYREDLQRRHGLKGALFRAAICATAHYSLRTTARPFRYSPSGNSMVIGWSGAAPRRSLM